MVIASGVIEAVLSAEGLYPHYLDFDFVPFGNNYFGISQCNSLGDANYSADARRCWARTCVNKDDPPEGCFNLTSSHATAQNPGIPVHLVTQHGHSEYLFNRLEATIKAMLHSDVRMFWPVVKCLEALEHLDFGNRTLEEYALPACIARTKLSASEVLARFAGDFGEQQLVRAAHMTVDHASVPAMLLDHELLANANGTLPFFDDYSWTPLAAICQRIRELNHGVAPPGCCDKDENKHGPPL